MSTFFGEIDYRGNYVKVTNAQGFDRTYGGGAAIVSFNIQGDKLFIQDDRGWKFIYDIPSGSQERSWT